MAEEIASEEAHMWTELDRLVLVPGLITGPDRSFIQTSNRVPPDGSGTLPDPNGPELYRIYNIYNDEIKP